MARKLKNCHEFSAAYKYSKQSMLNIWKKTCISNMNHLRGMANYLKMYKKFVSKHHFKMPKKNNDFITYNHFL